MKIRILLLGLLGSSLLSNASAQSPGAPAETKYLTFQVQTGLNGYASQFHPSPGRFSLTKAQMEEFVHSLTKAVGMTGDARHKLAFAIGPLCFDMPDEETRQFIRDAFAVARENDVAVALHIDDSMGWGERKDLIANPDNIETADWKQIPNKARLLQWGVSPTEFPPQMCYNAPAIVAAAKARAKLIGGEIARELATLKSQGKEHLFACVIAGWETQISQEFGTKRQLGFRALAHRGFSESHPPKDLDAERASVVKEWIELWSNSLREGGAPHEKIFCHIAFTDQGLRKADAKESYVQKVHFAPPEVAFSTAYRPGFSVYPEGATIKEVHAVVTAHASPGWISAEGCNVSPTSMPGEPTMETYLAKMFNHGAVLVNIYSWGIGGEAQREKNFFRKATENPQALADYAKFLRGEKLVESASQGFSSSGFQEKMQKIQAELPGWMQKTGRQSEAMSLMQKIQSLAKEKKWQEVDKAADDLLALIKGEPTATKAETPTTQPPPSPSPPSDDPTKRLKEKIERVKQGAKKWMESGRDISDIHKTMEEKFKPLIEAGKAGEAEAVLDSVLEQLNKDGKSAESPTASTQAAQPSADPAKTSKAGSAVLKPSKFGIEGGFGLFTQKPVQEELKLSDDQIKQLDVAQAKLREGYQALQALAPEERAKMLATQSVDGERAITEILKPEQIKRFKEISLQQDGPLLSVEAKDGEVSAAWQLTDDQKQKIKTIAEQIREALKVAGGDRNKLQELLRSGNEGVMQLLTEAQKTKWKEMIGEPFKGGFNSSQSGPVTQGSENKPQQSAPSGAAPDDVVVKRLTEKVERIKAGARQWAESGRDPSIIGKTMEEKFKPLMEAGNIPEAEAELDRVLKLLTEDGSTPDHPKAEHKAQPKEAATGLEQVATGFRLAETPVWDGESLIFADVFPSKILKLGSDGRVSTIRSETRKGAGLAFDSKHRLLICEVDGFRVTRIEKDGTETTLAESYDGKKLNGPNDLVVDAKDGIYFTDPLFLNKDKREQDKEAVYYISPAGKLLRVADDFEKPNGIALTGDGKTLLVADTEKSKLRAYPVKEDGKLGEGRDFGTVPGPDGVRVDQDGRVYAAGKTGIAVWDASGKPLGVLKVPAHLTSLAFGDADRRTMFITTNPTVFKIRLDQALKMLTTDEPSAAKDSPPAASPEAVHQRIAAKVARIKEGVQKLAESGSDPSAILTTMHEKVGPLLDAGKAIEAEPELDRVLKALGQEPDAGTESSKPAAPKAAAGAPSSQPDEATRKRLTEKVERVKAGARAWAESGRDPSVIGQTMEEKFKPLMEAGKIVEAEAVLDSVLEQLTKDTTNTESPPASAETVQQRIAAKIERIKAGAQKLAESGTDPSAILQTMGEKVGPLLDSGKFTEAEPEIDRVLAQLMPDGRNSDSPPSPAKSTDSPPAPAETVHTRIVAKIERLKAGVKKASEGGTDSSIVLKTTEEKLGPLIDAGKFVEAEAELDRVLEQLKQDTK